MLVPHAEARRSRESTQDEESEKWRLISETSFPPGKVDAFKNIFSRQQQYDQLCKGMSLVIQPDFRIEIQNWKFCRIGKILFLVIFFLLLVIILFMLYYAARKSMHPVSIYNFRIGTVIK